MVCAGADWKHLDSALARARDMDCRMGLSDTWWNSTLCNSLNFSKARLALFSTKDYVERLETIVLINHFTDSMRRMA